MTNCTAPSFSVYLSFPKPLLQFLTRTSPLLFSLLLAVGCAQTAVVAPTPLVITIAGSTEMEPVLAELTAAYSTLHPNVLFIVRGGGSLLGRVQLENRQVDLAASTAFPSTEETPTAFVHIPIGLDGVAVIVHPDNAVTGLTLAQLRDLYSGRLLDWQAVGGQSGGVLLVSREDGSATRILFEERVMDGEGVALTAVVMPTSEDMVEYVAEHPNAVGYVSRAYVMSDGAFGEETAPVRPVAIESRLPIQQEIATQSYYLTRPIFLIHRTSDVDQLQPFLDFILSPAGQEIVARYHVRIR